MSAVMTHFGYKARRGAVDSSFGTPFIVPKTPKKKSTFSEQLFIAYVLTQPNDLKTPNPVTD